MLKKYVNYDKVHYQLSQQLIYTKTTMFYLQLYQYFGYVRKAALLII